MVNEPSRARRLIYSVFGENVEKKKREQIVYLNDLYTKLSKEYDENHKWNSNEANAFQHAYQSALEAYNKNGYYSHFLGFFTEWSTWNPAEIKDINKDINNNELGIKLGLDAKEKGIPIEDVAKEIIKMIKEKDPAIIIDPNDSPIKYTDPGDSFQELFKNPYFKPFIIKDTFHDKLKDIIDAAINSNAAAAAVSFLLFLLSDSS